MVEPIETSILAFLEAVRRRRVLFFGALTTLLIAAVVAVFAITPRYTAEARVMVDPRAENVVNIEAVLSRLTADDPAIQSEIEVLRSEDLARRVIAQTNLDQSREFNPVLTRSVVGLLLRSLDWPWLNAAFGDILAGPDDAEQNRRVRAQVVEKYFDRLHVETLGRSSRVIGISFSSENPDLAARVANTIAETYVGLQVERKLEATEKASEWLKKRLAGLGGEVTASEQAIEDMRAADVAAGGWDPDLFQQQIGQVNSQLVQARAEQEQAQAELHQIDSLVAVKGDEAVFEVIDPQLLISTNETLMWLHRSEVELKAQYGPDHPAVAEVRAAIARLLKDTSARLIASARNRVEVASAKVRALESELRQLVEQSIAMRRAQVKLRAAERDAKATTELYQTLLTRSKETAQTGLEQSDARIISHASMPPRPSFPNRLLLIGVALVGSVALSGTLVGVAEGLESGYRGGDQLTRDLSLRVLGEIPAVGRRAQKEPLVDLLLSEPAGAYAEALRTVATSLELFGDPPERRRIVLITSSLPKEGKTNLVTCLARTIAATGRRVLVVDCDLRHPNCHTPFHLNLAPGLSTYLSDRARAEAVVQEDRASGAELIAAGEVTDSPLQLLRSGKLAHLLRDLRARYDIILLDSPPLLPIADTRLLTAVADRSVLVVRWRTTDRKSVRRAVEQLRQTGATPLAVVLNQVKDKTDQSYGHYYDTYRAAHHDQTRQVS
jgi:succinoglycan biosynthesis transport protein ExoP